MICREDACEREAKARGWCMKCYYYALKHGHFTPGEFKDRPDRRKSWTEEHLNILKRVEDGVPYSEVARLIGVSRDCARSAGRRYNIRSGLTDRVWDRCSHTGCNNPVVAKDLCGPHLGYAEAHPIRELVRSRAKVYGVTELQYARDNLGANIHYYSRDWWTPNMADRICTNLGVWSGDYLA